MSAAPAFSLERIEVEKRSTFNPIPHLTPETLTSQIDRFRAGYLRPLSLTMDAIIERDDLLAGVVPKALAAPTIHGWEINTVETDDEADAREAQRQKEVLEEFYNNLRVTSAMEQDQLGGVELLLEQMMEAKGKRYSVHNIVWQPRAGGYTATFWHAPLHFFEATKGRLRFLETAQAVYGVEMDPGAWLVTVGRGLMIACSVAWMYKRLPLRDWLVYCSRHGLPGFEGVTDEDEGSKGWQQLSNAVRAAAAGEFAWVRKNNQSINKIDFGAEGELPFPALVERMDRAMSAIWRGADLSTISSGAGAEGRGANLQGEEGDIIEAKDAQWLTGQLNLRVDRLVLDYVFGPETPALAYFKVLTAQKQNIDQDLKIDEFAMKYGHPISRQQFSERYNRPLPGDEDELLVAPAPPAPNPEDPRAVARAVNESPRVAAFLRKSRLLLGGSFRPVLKVLQPALNEALQGDDAAFRIRLRAVEARLPQVLADQGIAADTRDAFLRVFSTAFFNGLTDR